MTGDRAGILLMVAASFVFAVQDGISKYLSSAYGVPPIVMLRYVFLALFVTWLVGRRRGGLRRALATRRPLLQIGRGVLLALEINVAVLAFVLLGLAEAHAIFACYPLLLALFAGPILGERVGPRRWAAIAAGFLGVLIVLRPGAGVFSPYALIPLASATLFALYGLLTRLVARDDPADVSFFWTGWAGLPVAAAMGLWAWEPIAPADWGWMALLCLTGALGHFCLIKSYELAEASTVQPMTFLQLVFATGIGVTIFAEPLPATTVLGAAIVVAAGIFTLRRSAAAAGAAAGAVTSPIPPRPGRRPPRRGTGGGCGPSA